MKKIAIIGASYLQLPLILKAKEMGLETYVFAWQAGDPGETAADYFFPISIVEKDRILDKCREVGINGIATIASDLAVITVNHIAEKMGLIGNSMECTMKSTNKHLMRECFRKNGDPSVFSVPVKTVHDLDNLVLSFPLIVKPTDRSGSRAVTKVLRSEELAEAIDKAVEASFEKKALVEEYAEGDEYSIECITCNGVHHFLAMTKKYTTGAPHFIETGHMEPCGLEQEMVEKVRQIVFHALDGLGIRNSASHSEVKIDKRGNIRIIEIGGRMGGDMIGSDLVELTTGIDYVKAVIETAMGDKPELHAEKIGKPAGIRFILSEHDLESLRAIETHNPEYVLRKEVHDLNIDVTDSSNRSGYYLLSTNDPYEVDKMIRE